MKLKLLLDFSYSLEYIVYFNLKFYLFCLNSCFQSPTSEKLSQTTTKILETKKSDTDLKYKWNPFNMKFFKSYDVKMC